MLSLTYCIFCYKGIARVSRSKERNGGDRVTLGLKDVEDFVLWR